MNQAIGLIEVQGYGTAITIADVMMKVAAVELIGVQRAKGFGWMTVEIAGDVGAVKAAVDAGKAQALENGSLISALVIPRPAESLDTMLLNRVDYPKPAPAVVKATAVPAEVASTSALAPSPEQTAKKAPVPVEPAAAETVTETAAKPTEAPVEPVAEKPAKTVKKAKAKDAEAKPVKKTRKTKKK